MMADEMFYPDGELVERGMSEAETEQIMAEAKIYCSPLPTIHWSAVPGRYYLVLKSGAVRFNGGEYSIHDFSIFSYGEWKWYRQSAAPLDQHPHLDESANHWVYHV